MRIFIGALTLEDTGKPMKSQGASAIVVDTVRSREVLSEHRFHLMPRFFSPFAFRNASYWWWYGTATEGASGV